MEIGGSIWALTGIDSSALGDDRSQGIVERSRMYPWVEPHGKCVACQTGQCTYTQTRFWSLGSTRGLLTSMEPYAAVRRGARPVEINRFTMNRISWGLVGSSWVLSKYEITPMALKASAVEVKPATVHTLTIQSGCIFGYPILFSSGRFRETT